MESGKSEKVATLYRMVMTDHLCPYGLKSKDLLERQGFTVEDHHLKAREETDAFQREHGVDTTPQTFIDGRRIGGYDDLREHFGKEVQQEDETSYKPPADDPAPEPRPIAWHRELDGGRTFYTGLGHTTESWADPRFLDHVWGGVIWALGS